MKFRYLKGFHQNFAKKQCPSIVPVFGRFGFRHSCYGNHLNFQKYGTQAW